MAAFELCSGQYHPLKFITFCRDGFVWFQKRMMGITDLVPQNTEQNHICLHIRPSQRHRSITTPSHDFSFSNTWDKYLFLTFNNSMKRTLPFPAGAVVYQRIKNVQRPFGFKSKGTDVSWYWVILSVISRFKMAWQVAPSAEASFFALSMDNNWPMAPIHSLQSFLTFLQGNSRHHLNHSVSTDGNSHDIFSFRSESL